MGQRRSESIGRRLSRTAIAAGITTALFALLTGCGGSTETPTQTLELVLTDTTIEGDLLGAAGKVRFRAVNKGTKSHNLLAVGRGTRSYPPGAIETLELGELAPGKYAVWCDLVGHREAGMETVLTITE